MTERLDDEPAEIHRVLIRVNNAVAREFEPVLSDGTASKGDAAKITSDEGGEIVAKQMPQFSSTLRKELYLSFPPKFRDDNPPDSHLEEDNDFKEARFEEAFNADSSQPQQPKSYRSKNCVIS